LRRAGEEGFEIVGHDADDAAARTSWGLRVPKEGAVGRSMCVKLIAGREQEAALWEVVA